MVVLATIIALLFSLPDLYKCISVLLGCALSGNITKTFIKQEGNKDLIQCSQNKRGLRGYNDTELGIVTNCESKCPQINTKSHCFGCDLHEIYKTMLRLHGSSKTIECM